MTTKPVHQLTVEDQFELIDSKFYLTLKSLNPDTPEYLVTMSGVWTAFQTATDNSRILINYRGPSEESTITWDREQFEGSVTWNSTSNNN